MLTQERDGIVGLLETQLHDAVLEQLFDVVLVHVALALAQRLVLGRRGLDRRRRLVAITVCRCRRSTCATEIEQRVHFSMSELVFVSVDLFFFLYFLFFFF